MGISRAARVAALLLAGCGRGPDRLEHVEVALDATGAVHLLAQRVSGEDEGGSFSPIGFRHAALRDGVWRSEAIPAAEGSLSEYGETAYLLLRGPGEAMTFVVDAREGTRAYTGAENEWAEVTADDALPAEARAVLDTPGALGSAWIGDDGALRLLVDAWLFEAHDGRIDRAFPLGERCRRRDDWAGGIAEPDGYLRMYCMFDATGDRAGDAMIFDFLRGAPHTDPITRLRSARLSCAGDACSFSVDAVPQLEFPPTRTDDDFALLHDADGGPALVHTSWQPSITTADGRVELRVGRPIGAASRPGGGFVAASMSNRTLFITVVSASLEAHDIEVIGPPNDYPEAIGVAVETLGGGERAHMVWPIDGETAFYIVVDLATDRIERSLVAM